MYEMYSARRHRQAEGAEMIKDILAIAGLLILIEPLVAIFVYYWEFPLFLCVVGFSCWSFEHLGKKYL